MNDIDPPSVIISFLFLIIFFIGLFFIYEEIDFRRRPVVNMNAEFISYQYVPDTRCVRPVTTIGCDGNLSIGSIATGSDEKYITLWKTKELGIVPYQNKELFQNHSNKCILKVKIKGKKHRIVGYK